MQQFNDSQLLAINSPERDVIIVAPPGSGKTHTMTGAISKFLDENPINSGVTAITFTNKAADELKERLGFRAGSIHTATIHSWSYTELKKLSEKHNFRMRILDENAIRDILRNFMNQFGVQLRYIDGVYNYTMGNINPDLPFYIASKYAQVSEQYKLYKRKMYLYDFTDYPLYLADQLTKYGEYIYLDAIFIDEFQDVDPIQLGVFERVVANKRFFIGDPDQAIYQFRGATEDIFAQLPGYTEYTLYENYRSYQSIIDFSFLMKNSETMPEVIRLIPQSFVKASRGNGGQVHYISPIKSFINAGEYDLINEYGVNRVRLDNLIKLFNENSFTFLCRTNREVKKVNELGFHDVMTVHKAKGLEFDNVVVLDFENKSDEDVNVRFVAHTRAKNILVCLNFELLESISKKTTSGVKKLF